MARILAGVLVALSLLAQCRAMPTSSSTVHEKRPNLDARSHSWSAVSRLPPDSIVPVRIALTQSNLHVGAGRLMSISHPASTEYGQTLNASETRDLFAPTEESIQIVRDWLLDSGIPDATIAHSDSRGWLAMDMTAAHTERLFQSELYEYVHTRTGRAVTTN